MHGVFYFVRCGEGFVACIQGERAACHNLATGRGVNPLEPGLKLGGGCSPTPQRASDCAFDFKEFVCI